MRLPLAVVVSVLSSGCTLWFTGDGDDTIDPCPLYEATGTPSDPAIAEVQYRNPSTLTCESFGYPCNDQCGPCPGAADLAQPSWGMCGSSCEGLSESACGADASCRVVKDAACSFGAQLCLTDYLGCFPVDQVVDDTVDCFAADAQQCSRSPRCTAYHSTEPCSSMDPDQCSRPFEVCAPAGSPPGSCTGAVACDELPPACPTTSTPGIADGCYTGACIPRDLCGPSV